MANSELLAYVKKQLSLNVPKETIVSNVKGAGWTDEDINEVFTALQTPSVVTAVPVSPLPTTSSSEAASREMYQPKIYPHKSKKLVSAVIVLILLAVAGGGAAYAYRTGVFVSLPNLMTESMEKTSSATSYLHDFTFKIDLSGISATDSNPLSMLGTDSKEIIFNMKGASDLSDKENLKTSSVISITSGSLTAEIEMRLISDTLYAKLSKFPDLDPLSSQMLAAYKDKWFSFSYNDDMGAYLSSIKPKTKNKLTAEQAEYINKLFRDAHIIKPASRLPSEEVDGVASHHFSFDVDKKALASFMETTAKYMDEINGNNAESSSRDPELLSEVLDKVKNFKGEIWVGRSDKLMRKVSVSFGIQADSEKEEQVKVSATGIMSNWNEPVVIVAPQESVSLMSLVQASLNSARQKGAEASVISTLSMLRVSAEIFWDQTANAGNGYNGSYAGFCKSKELKDAEVNVESVGGTGFVCRDIKSAYKISVKLPQSTSYWCVDSTGASRKVGSVSSGTTCPAK